MSSIKENRIANWFKNLKTEFTRIVWPSKDNLIKETIAVIIISVLLGGLIAVVDSIFKFLINLILK